MHSILSKPGAVLRRLTGTARVMAGRNAVVAYWYRGRRNFGDELSPFLIERLSGRRPVHVADVLRSYDGPVHAVVGSILQSVRAPNAVYWGSGFISADSRFAAPPAAVHAVRGPLTRASVLAQGLACPDVYGDPALLLPRFLPLSRAQETRMLGLIPHYVDKPHPLVARLAAHDDCRLIDVQTDPLAVARAISECAAVASTSLHGVILALAYGVPAVWIKITDEVAGDGFKFRDFFASIGALVTVPHTVSAQTSIAELRELATAWPIDLDLDRLLAASPFTPPAS